MRCSVFVTFFGLLVAAFLAISHASPVELPDAPAQYEELEIFGRTSGDSQLVRIRRASCDLFSFSSKWLTPNHSVCAAHCIARGKRGGNCKGSVCHCRT